MSGRENWDEWERDAGEMEVVAGELVLTTAGRAGIPEYAPLAALLQRVHQAFGVEMAFVSEWCGEPVARARPDADALHAVYGRRCLERTAPPGKCFCFDALPVITGDGRAHGTLCCRLPQRPSFDAEIEGAVHGVARLIANWFAAACVSA